MSVKNALWPTVRWGTPVYSRSDTRLPEIMGLPPQAHISWQPACKHQSRSSCKNCQKNAHDLHKPNRFIGHR